MEFQWISLNFNRFHEFPWISWNFHGFHGVSILGAHGQPWSSDPARELRCGPGTEIRPRSSDPDSDLRSSLRAQIRHGSCDPDDRFRKLFAHGLGRLAPKLDLGSSNMNSKRASQASSWILLSLGWTKPSPFLGFYCLGLHLAKSSPGLGFYCPRV